MSAAAKADAAAAAAEAATATAAELSKDLADTVVRKNAEISDISQKYERELAEIEENLKKENEHKEKIKNELLILEFYYYIYTLFKNSNMDPHTKISKLKTFILSQDV